MDLEVDRALSRWLQYWRSCFRTWTTISLDLANHPPERVMTHCMQVLVQPRNFEKDPAKQYEAIEASVVPISEVMANHPALEVTIDPTDFTRLRFVVIMQNLDGEMQRLRLIQWNDRNLDEWRKIPKESSAAMGGPNSKWAEVLISSVSTMDPQEVEKRLGRHRS